MLMYLMQNAQNTGFAVPVSTPAGLPYPGAKRWKLLAPGTPILLNCPVNAGSNCVVGVIGSGTGAEPLNISLGPCNVE
jgi:hypothetical protein